MIAYHWINALIIANGTALYKTEVVTKLCTSHDGSKWVIASPDIGHVNFIKKLYSIHRFVQIINLVSNRRRPRQEGQTTQPIAVNTMHNAMQWIKTIFFTV